MEAVVVEVVARAAVEMVMAVQAVAAMVVVVRMVAVAMAVAALGVAVIERAVRGLVRVRVVALLEEKALLLVVVGPVVG